jgi:hypothetical protein
MLLSPTTVTHLATQTLDPLEWVRIGCNADDTQVPPKGVLASYALGSPRMEETIPLRFRGGRGFPRWVSWVLSSCYEIQWSGNSGG